ncbi:helix-turn-helix domain-containing protein [Azospirillum doebereinerae]
MDVISCRQIRAARALLGWSRQTLAEKATISENALARLERGEVDTRTSTLQSVRRALEAAGVEFIWVKGKEGVLISDAD